MSSVALTLALKNAREIKKILDRAESEGSDEATVERLRTRYEEAQAAVEASR